MIEEKIDLFSITDLDVALCIPTNGYVTREGKATMGAGVALQAKKLYPQCVDILGALLSVNGNVVQRFWIQPILVAFPTKHYWKDKSDLELIKKSANGLVELANVSQTIRKFYLPRPGCGLGGLNWEGEVRPLIEPILNNDKFVITDWT